MPVKRSTTVSPAASRPPMRPRSVTLPEENMHLVASRLNSTPYSLCVAQPSAPSSNSAWLSLVPVLATGACLASLRVCSASATAGQSSEAGTAAQAAPWKAPAGRSTSSPSRSHLTGSASSSAACSFAGRLAPWRESSDDMASLRRRAGDCTRCAALIAWRRTSPPDSSSRRPATPVSPPPRSASAAAAVSGRPTSPAASSPPRRAWSSQRAAFKASFICLACCFGSARTQPCGSDAATAGFSFRPDLRPRRCCLPGGAVTAVPALPPTKGATSTQCSAPWIVPKAKQTAPPPTTHSRPALPSQRPGTAGT
mmetsp:Transcript_36061/g.93655  ORF Transcript_36061/g.93655 Transcript_36061/m.93655 type:complete len:311 (+) Transcript_36061:539-1471(+)